MDYPNISGKEFSKIINLFKTIVYTVSIGVTVLVSVALFVAYKDLASMRADVREEARLIREDLSTLRAEASQNINETREFSFSQIRSTRDYAIREAQASAEQRINQLFLSDDIQALIAQVAESNIRSEVDEIVESEFTRVQDRISSRINKSIELSYCQQLITNCSRDYLVMIDSIAQFGRSEEEREIARYIYESKENDYKSVYRIENYDLSNQQKLDSAIAETLYFPVDSIAEMDRLTKIDFLTELTYKEYNLCKVAPSLILLGHIIGENIGVFDFDEIPRIRRRFELETLSPYAVRKRYN